MFDKLVRSFPVFVAVGALTACAADEPEPVAGPIHARVMTFNVLCSFCDDSYEPWDARLEYIADTVARHDPDLIGFQEFLTGAEVDQVASRVPGYGTIYLVDENAPLFDEYADALIFYRASRYELVRQGFYFLSDTPDEYWSSGWSESQFWRLVAWAHLRQREDGRDFYFATTHVDNNPPNQVNSAPVILDKTASWAKTMPSLVVGDFNSKPDSEAYRILTQGAVPGGFRLFDTHDFAQTTGTVHNRDTPPGYDPSARIDHIFVASPNTWSCSDWTVDQYVYGPGQQEPSDHYAIIATVTLN